MTTKRQLRNDIDLLLEEVFGRHVFDSGLVGRVAALEHPQSSAKASDEVVRLNDRIDRLEYRLRYGDSQYKVYDQFRQAGADHAMAAKGAGIAVREMKSC